MMCIAWLLSLLGCGMGQPVDGPGMERGVWSEFTLSRCSELFEPIYSYTVNYDDILDEAYLHIKIYEGQTVDKSIGLKTKTLTELFNLEIMSLPDTEPLCRTFLGLSVTDLNGQVSSKNISSQKENEILTLLTPYVDALKADSDAEDPFMLDGPDMEYTPPWTEFTLSRRDSNTLYTFWFTVKDANGLPLVTGMCQDARGCVFQAEAGIPLDTETLWELRDMTLEQLPEADDNEDWPEDLERPLDDSNITLTVTVPDGTILRKKASGELSMEIYKLLLPCLQNF